MTCPSPEVSKRHVCLLLRVLPFELLGIIAPPIMDYDTEKRGIVISVKITNLTR